jgi:hypothetical protein
MTHDVEWLIGLCQGQIQPCGWRRNIEDGNGRVIIIGPSISTIFHASNDRGHGNNNRVL